MDEITTLKKVLNQYQITPSKKLGQHFLVNNNIIHKIIRSSGNIKNKNVLEVGPGIGALTKVLLQMDLKSLTTIEIDKKISDFLSKIHPCNTNNFRVLNDDALKIKEENIIDGNFTILANLPYNTSVFLIIKWIKKIQFIDQIIVMVQKEVANRIIGEVSTRNYGRLSILAQLNCECELLFDVEPSNFFPPPKVMSSIIKLKPKKQRLTTIEMLNTEKVCKILFAFRRKKIHKGLKYIIADPKKILTFLEIDYNKRCEQLTSDEFLKISSIITV